MGTMKPAVIAIGATSRNRSAGETVTTARLITSRDTALTVAPAHQAIAATPNHRHMSRSVLPAGVCGVRNAANSSDDAATAAAHADSQAPERPPPQPSTIARA